jgi:hypothetical protein
MDDVGRADDIANAAAGAFRKVDAFDHYDPPLAPGPMRRR